ncbi:serine/threonine-protein kinase ATR-like isoform X2 [Mya arenaria]|uniref:serine/threonine-protein kinase ATR-like isoform X2 n=1 Tax=Mya arenaria TaxID=6604 RepID=UPI0022E1CD6A|nr:serine/threonine-protein kinase ATR-like isoform X2 [Mya arenaria]
MYINAEHFLGDSWRAICQTFTKFCEIFLEQRREVFISPPLHTTPNTPPLNKPISNTVDEEFLTQSYLRWYLSRILVLLGYTSCEGIHGRTREIIVQLLQAIKSRDVYYFAQILREIVHCIIDLVEISEQMFGGKLESAKLQRLPVDMDLVLRSLQEPAERSNQCEVVLTPAQLNVDDVEYCEQLQLNLTKVLCDIGYDLGSFCPIIEAQALLESLCCQLEIGEVSLKTESLRLACVLLHSCPRIITDIELCNFFLDCVVAMVRLLCTGLPLVTDLKDSDHKKFEHSAASVLLELVALSTGEFPNLGLRGLEQLLEGLGETLQEEGLGRLKTHGLRAALGSLMANILETLPTQHQLSFICMPHRSRLVRALTNEIGTSTDLQYLVGCLVKAVLCELMGNQTSVEGISLFHSDTPKASGNARKRKLDGSVLLAPKVPNKSKTYKILMMKLHTFLTEENQVDVRAVEGVQMIIEVTTCCINMCRQETLHPPVLRPQKEYSEFGSWLNKEHVNDLCGFMFTTLQFAAQKDLPAADVTHVYLGILKIIGALLAVQDAAEFDAETNQTFGWMASLPWLLNDPSWVDLKPANPRGIVKVTNVLAPKLDEQCSAECVGVLALLPKDVAHKWRVHIFRQALCDGGSLVKVRAIQSFPNLLYHLGPNANHLVYDLLHSCVSDGSDDKQKALAGIVGHLACVVSRKAILNKSPVVSLERPMYTAISVGCLSCDGSDLVDVTGSPRERPRLVDANMFLPFMQLAQSDSVHIRKVFIESLRYVFGHIGVRKNNAATINILTTALKFVEDTDYDIRVAFSEVVQHVFGGEEMSGSDDTSDLVLTKLQDVFTQARVDSNVRLQETLLLTIGQLGRVWEGQLLVTVIIFLLESMLLPIPLVAATGYEQLKDIADYKNTQTQNLFMRCRHDVCKFLVNAMHDAQTGKMGKSADDILTEVSRVLGFPDVKTFLSGTKKYIVPYLVSKGTPAASTLVKLIATHLDIASRSKLLLNNTKFVFSYLVRTKPREADLHAAIQYLQRETNIDLPNLLRLDFQRVHNELLLHLSTNFSQVFNGLKMLSTFDENWKGGVVSTHEDMAAYLQPRILGVLAHFDSPLLNASIPMEEKRPTLESLISIIRLMGSKIISGIRHKVMSTLRIGLQIKDEQFTEISCRAWNCFVRSLELPFLGQMMSQIIATLLPLLELMPKQVADIFNYMIVDNRETMKSQFHDIYFLPDLPELAEANAVLKKYTDNLASQLDFKSQLRHTLKGVQHESLDVRLHALSKLKKLLKDERVAFSELVMESETASPLVSGLISVLLKGCREGDVRAQGLYAECLGQCGAIDPGRLELATNNPKVELANFQNSILKEKFAFALINEVVKSYLAATEPRIQDCSALALQDLLQIYGISEKSEDERTQKLWNGFTSQVKEILIPFMSTKYILAPTQYNWANLHKPIYGSRKGSTFKDWVSTWTLYLSSKVRAEGKPFKVFRACSAVIKFNVHLALYILPYVVLHVLQDGTQADINEVVVEIEEVLTQVTGMDGGRAKVAVGFHHMAAQTIFSVLDYLTKWKFLSQQIKAAGSQGETALSRVKGFLECIPQDKLAEASFQCKAYTRALMHYELHLKGKQKLTKEQLDFLQRLYRELDEPDGVQGVAAIRQSTPSLSEQILTYSGRLGCQVELQACYEQAIQNEPEDLSHHQGLLRCLMDLSQPAQALHHASGAIANTQGWMLQLLPFQVEAAWKLGHWTDLQNFSTKDTSSRSWPVMLGRILLAAKSKSEGEFLKQLQVARQEQVGPLSAASMEMGSYQRGYEHIVRLHILNEIVESLQLLMDFLGDGGQGSLNIGIPDLMAHWQTRLKMMQSSFRIQEPVLTMRRTLMTLAQQDHDINFDIETEIAHSWLSSAKTAQKTGYVQTATRFLLQASEYNLPQYCLQKAKWHWEKDEHEQAMSLLEQQMVVHFTNVNQILADQSEAGKAKRRVYAKALLLYGRYSEETSRIESNQIVKKYKEVIETDPEWEHGHFYLGKYFDKIMTTLVDEKNDVSKQGEFVVHVVKNLGNSLRHGNTFIYQSLPRLLSLWLDFGSSVVELEKREQPRPSMSLQKNRSYLGKLNKMIETFGRQLAPYQLFFAFSQLTSRICHAHQEVFIQLKTIIARLVVAFPQQALWMLMAVSKSSLKTRSVRCQEIFATAKEATPSLAKVIQDYTKLTERLLELCEKELEAGKSVSITTYFKPLKRLIDDSSLSKILVPLQSLMTVNLPSTVDRDREHDPFPANLVYISGFEDDIEILASLAKPKKITMKGSDGQKYVMLCKPNDDLRKDCRLMEFNGIVNKFLRKDPESRKRFLYMRTYTVIPLNELCGLLEWVNNTRGLRAILIQLYKEKGLYMPGKELQGAMPNLQASIETKKQALRTKLLPRHPPVFGEWFLRTFTDPTSWYNARLAYCKTVAVMSMVGYILGLGDRHGENILFDSTNGDCVHVDFNCLFNRGETFEWPEKVPFRLTHNMVHAMGPTRLEGIYRRACEVTLRVMRKETEPLMSVLKPFVYDPLVEWSKPARGQRQNPAPLNPTGEVTNEQGRVHVQNIEQRLQGILNKGTKRSGLALSVEGHVNHLINEATSEENLCQMYIGWAAYL